MKAKLQFPHNVAEARAAQAVKAGGFKKCATLGTSRSAPKKRSAKY